MQPHFHSLKPVFHGGNLVERTVGDIDGLPLVLFHKTGPLVSAAPNACQRSLQQIGWNSFIELDDDQWPWCQSDQAKFNCHSLAIGSGVSLTPHDWLEGKASEATLGQNPAQLILDRYYQRVSSSLADNDVFVLRDSTANHLVHSGLARIIDGVPVAISKFGEGPILITSFELVMSVFQQKFDQLVWYRLR